MDNERLEKLKGITEQLYQDGNVPLTCCDDVIDLIDETTARQSATSEEVQRAINDVRDSLMHSETNGIYCEKPINQRTANLAITSLQAYQPTISKTETTTCEWCKGVVGEFFDVLWYDFVNRKRGSVNYCPNCGRRLENDNGY